MNELLTGSIYDLYPGAHEFNTDGNTFARGFFYIAFMQYPNLIAHVDVLNAKLVNRFRLTIGP